MVFKWVLLIPERDCTPWYHLGNVSGSIVEYSNAD